MRLKCDGHSVVVSLWPWPCVGIAMWRWRVMDGAPWWTMTARHVPSNTRYEEKMWQCGVSASASLQHTMCVVLLRRTQDTGFAILGLANRGKKKNFHRTDMKSAHTIETTSHCVYEINTTMKTLKWIIRILQNTFGLNSSKKRTSLLKHTSHCVKKIKTMKISTRSSQVSSSTSDERIVWQ